jgi:hypothetical protein
MDFVYENNTLTLAATSSPGCQADCFVANPTALGKGSYFLIHTAEADKIKDCISTYEILWEDEQG